MFRELHDNPYAGHPGYQKFITTLKKDLLAKYEKRSSQICGPMFYLLTG